MQMQQPNVMVINTGMMGGLGMTTDPSLKCHFEDCQMIGMGHCHWDNCCLLSKKTGGCGKRVCQAHRYYPHIVRVGNNNRHHNNHHQ